MHGGTRLEYPRRPTLIVRSPRLLPGLDSLSGSRERRKSGSVSSSYASNSTGTWRESEIRTGINQAETVARRRYEKPAVAARNKAIIEHSMNVSQSICMRLGESQNGQTNDAILDLRSIDNRQASKWSPPKLSSNLGSSGYFVLRK